MARALKGYPAVLPEEYPVSPAPGFADVPPYGLEDAVLTARLGLMKGYSETTFDPYAPAQRAHVAVVMTRFLDLASYVAPPAPTTTTTTAITTTTTIAVTTTTVAPTTTTIATSTPATTTTTTAAAPPAAAAP